MDGRTIESSRLSSNLTGWVLGPGGGRLNLGGGAGRLARAGAANALDRGGGGGGGTVWDSAVGSRSNENMPEKKLRIGENIVRCP